MNGNKLSKEETIKSSSNTRVALVVLGIIVALIITITYLIVQTANSNKENIGNFFSGFCIPSEEATKTSVIVLGKNKVTTIFDGTMIEVLVYNSQYGIEATIKEREKIADQLRIGDAYAAIRVEKTKFNRKKEIGYEFVIGNKYYGKKLQDIELSSVDKLEADIEELRYDDSQQETQYFATVSFNDKDTRQNVTSEIDKELYDTMLITEKAVISKKIYNVGMNSTLVDYEVASNE